ncbi:MAG: hypothetical protein AMXMBFR7_47970 [Planctomycetota bacterium]
MPTLEIALTDDVDQPVVREGMIGLTPVFYGNGRESAPCAMLTVKDRDGKVASRFLLVVNGRHLTLELQDRSKPVMSAIERSLLAGKA